VDTPSPLCVPEPTVIVEKAWGHEVIRVNTEAYCFKELHVEPGMRCSLHYHAVKDETFIVAAGVAVIQLGDEVKTYWPNYAVRVRPGVKHRFGSYAGCVLHEVSTHHEDADVVRLEQSGAMPDGW
jgi:mannose-6-phosphate isomerase-like protein (cupin superfamily)